MAKYSGLIDVFNNSSFILKFSNVYAGRMNARELIKESGLPAWFIYEMFEHGLIQEDKVIDISKLNIILTAMFCYQNIRFIKASFRNLSMEKRKRVVRREDNPVTVAWVKGRVESYIKDNKRVSVKNILEEVFALYPNLYNNESRNVIRLARVIRSHKRVYRRKISR